VVTSKKLGVPPLPKNKYRGYQLIDAALRCGFRVLPIWPWTERAALWWGYRFRPAPSVAKLRSGPSIYISHTDYLQLLIYYFGTYEPYCLPYLRGCAKRGGTIIDVGANIGFYTLESALAVGPTGHVISIEAAPPHVEAIRKNILLNGMTNISLIEVAVADSVGEAMLSLPQGDNLGMFTLGAVTGDQSYRVTLRPMDDLLAEHASDSISLIKMDIEGAEYRALLGAAKTLAKHKPSLLIELNEGALRRCGSSTQAVKDLLTETGYRGWIIRRNGISPISGDKETHDCDECLFIHRQNEVLMHRLCLPQV
jgi:FkbM family methyltransferase